METIQSIRGFRDSLPRETAIWQKIEEHLKKVISSYGYNEIRFPIIEKTALFQRAIGEITDIVEKEMFTFNDRNGNSLSLRPEGTVGCVRAGIEHGILYNQEQRLWYIGPMFRYERPQKGRYRQFNQLGVEVFGLNGPDIDAELIIITERLWRSLGISEHVSLEINSIGSIEERSHYRNELMVFLERNKEKLDEDCKRRMRNNPLRILDSKNPDIQELLNSAPNLKDHLDDDSRHHFSGLCRLLENVGISYTINPRLVRGLDYYNRTVFEWISINLGTKSTFCAGGRYDQLVKQLGGYKVPAVGFAVGLERIVTLVQTVNSELKIGPSIVDVYLIVSGSGTQSVAMIIAERIRDVFPNIKLMTHHGGGSVKKQFSIANKLGARIALFLGELEVETNKIVIKDLQSSKQVKVAQGDIIAYLRTLNLK